MEDERRRGIRRRGKEGFAPYLPATIVVAVITLPCHLFARLYPRSTEFKFFPNF